jgi:anti-sigma regulatory factor (Ser/Thr protein kinase)
LIVAAVDIESASATDKGAMYLRLPFDSSAPREARHLVRGWLAELADQPVVETAELLAGELVTNAIMYGVGECLLSGSYDDLADTLVIRVHDASATIPTAEPHPSELPGGRGLWLVNHLALQWGTEVVTDGKDVWFKLARHG